MAVQDTFIIIKPDAMARGLAGSITARLEGKGLQLVGCKLTKLSDEILTEHYSHLADKPFFPGIVEFMQSTAVLMQVWRGVDAVAVVRTLAGPTNGRDAAPGTIRGDFSQSIQCNVMHASDGPDTAREEVARFFQPSEVLDWDRLNVRAFYGSDEE
ncbi:MAG: nucleoside-diphosphate kinase [Myxococcota bacterium]|jgi:nucleoside-diphosphate kinase